MESVEIVFEFGHILLVKLATVTLQLHLMHGLLQLLNPTLHGTHISPPLQFLVVVFDHGQLILDLLVNPHQGVVE